MLLLTMNIIIYGQQEEALVYLEHSETLNFDDAAYPGAQLLKGNVRFRHEDALMFCDSAYFYEGSNSLDAFGHVKLIQGDTLAGYGDILYYDGSTKLARFRRNVKLVHTGMTLTTDSLNYDRSEDIAWYYTGGVLEDSVNTLTSIWGQYTPPNHQALFKQSVHLINDKFILDADSLKYNTETNIADIIGETDIVYEEETNIHSTAGHYNTRSEQSTLLNRSQVIHKDGKTLTADTIFYDKACGIGDLRSNFEMKDTVQKATLYGNFGFFWESDKRGYATDSALLIDWSTDDWLYIHADTLYTEQVPDTIPDSLYRQVRAYYGVRVYRSDMQAVCDSLRFNGRDSIISLYYAPIVWSDEQQISSDSIHVYMKNGSVEHLHGLGKSIAIQYDGEDNYNQMSGKEILAFVRDGELREVHVNGNAQTIYYPHEDEDEGEPVGVNKTESSYVKLYIVNRKIDHILFTAAATGAVYPLDQIAKSDTRLELFFWADDKRPRLPGDVFSSTGQTTLKPPGDVLIPEAMDNDVNENIKNKITENIKDKIKGKIE